MLLGVERTGKKKKKKWNSFSRKVKLNQKAKKKKPNGRKLKALADTNPTNNL